MRRGLIWGVHEDLPFSTLPASIKQWFRRYASSQETLGCAVLSEQLMMDYHRRLLRFQPTVLYGYPSALAQFGRFIESRRLTPMRVNTIFTTAERLAQSVRSELTRLFGGEVFNLYATREHGCIGFECEHHQGFHIDTGSVFLEIVKDGRLVPNGEHGEIVVTDLLNYGMPFIRSRIGDMGALSPNPCACGSPLPVLTGLDGRSSDLLHRPDGSVVPGLLITDLFTDLASIRFSQFVQETVDRLDVRLVVSSEFTDRIEAEVLRQVRAIMGNEITIHISIVDHIERNPRSGKFREVICNVDAHGVSGCATHGMSE
jgi:phenylacetate-CoA ligase